MARSSDRLPETDDLLELSRAAVDGNAAALERLIWMHHRRLLEYVERKVGDGWAGKIEPEDVLQQAYISVFRHIDEFTPHDENSFYHWTVRIANHRFLDEVRRLRRKKRDSSREISDSSRSAPKHQSLLDQCIGLEPTASHLIRYEEAVAALMGCIARLPEHYQVVVQRYYLDQEPLESIAQDMQRSVDATRRLASRALKKLSECLGRASHFFNIEG
jgi:RNA polymerase sigma factor (sigma-70 family)